MSPRNVREHAETLGSEANTPSSLNSGLRVTEEIAVDATTLTNELTFLEPRVADIVVDPMDVGRTRLESTPFAFAAKSATAGVNDASVADVVTSTYVPAQVSQKLVGNGGLRRLFL